MSFCIMKIGILISSAISGYIRLRLKRRILYHDDNHEHGHPADLVGQGARNERTGEEPQHVDAADEGHFEGILADQIELRDDGIVHFEGVVHVVAFARDRRAGGVEIVAAARSVVIRVRVVFQRIITAKVVFVSVRRENGVVVVGDGGRFDVVDRIALRNHAAEFRRRQTWSRDTRFSAFRITVDIG